MDPSPANSQWVTWDIEVTKMGTPCALRLHGHWGKLYISDSPNNSCIPTRCPTLAMRSAKRCFFFVFDIIFWSHLIIFYLTMPCLALPCTALPCPALSCPVLSILSCPVLPCPALPLHYTTLPYPTLLYICGCSCTCRITCNTLSSFRDTENGVHVRHAYSSQVLPKQNTSPINTRTQHFNAIG